ncbi:pyridoxal phosphate-dependent aminotransferase [Paradesulfitobacterium aromaticivorans]
MRYDFDEVIERKHTNSLKWDFAESKFGEKDLLPMWVADMDFKVPQPVTEAIVRKAEEGVYGYADRLNPYYEAVIGWMERRHGWKIEREWITYSPGVVSALHWLVRAYTNPGDKVVIQAPVYYPFYSAVENNGCDIVINELRLENGHYRMDFNDLEQKLKDNPDTKLLILCSPHNPVGRVWTREELTRLGEICLRHKVMIVADEIHADLVYEGCKHTPLAMISEELAQNSITCTAPSKTFNLAGLQTSNIIIPNRDLRRTYLDILEQNGVRRPNIFGIVATEAAYNDGEEWLEQLLVYLNGNLDFLTDFISKKLPKVKVIKPEGTYLVWLDFREYGLDGKALENLMLRKAKLALDEGYIFGTGGEGFERINIACPRAVLAEGLTRIENAFNVLE